MNERLEDLMYESGLTAQGCWDEMDEYDRKAIKKLFELTVQDCANYVRNNYDSKDAEVIAYYLELNYGLRGEY